VRDHGPGAKSTLLLCFTQSHVSALYRYAIHPQWKFRQFAHGSRDAVDQEHSMIEYAMRTQQTLTTSEGISEPRSDSYKSCASLCSSGSSSCDGYLLCLSQWDGENPCSCSYGRSLALMTSTRTLLRRWKGFLLVLLVPQACGRVL
jgi:hypothetical protein